MAQHTQRGKLLPAFYYNTRLIRNRGPKKRGSERQLMFKKYLFFPQDLKFGDSIASRFIDVCNVSWGPWEDLVVSEPESDFLEKQILEISDSQKKEKENHLFSTLNGIRSMDDVSANCDIVQQIITWMKNSTCFCFSYLQCSSLHGWFLVRIVLGLLHRSKYDHLWQRFFLPKPWQLKKCFVFVVVISFLKSTTRF